MKYTPELDTCKNCGGQPRNTDKAVVCSDCGLCIEHPDLETAKQVWNIRHWRDKPKEVEYRQREKLRCEGCGCKTKEPPEPDYRNIEVTVTKEMIDILAKKYGGGFISVMITLAVKDICYPKTMKSGGFWWR